MTASRVTPPTNEEGVDVDGAEEAGGVTVSIRTASDEAGPYSV